MQPKPFDASVLLPGDHLLYRPAPASIYSNLVAVKTWTRVSHVEVYIGADQAVAARYPEGCHVFTLDTERVNRVLRPREQFDLESAKSWWYRQAEGQGYDFWGQLIFFLAVRHGNNGKMFCSEAAVRFGRNGRFHAFAQHWDADRVAPGDFMKSRQFEIVWDDGLPV